MSEISVVVPVYNSADCLAELARRLHSALQEDYELILVNDQSQDESWPVIEKLARDYATVTGINLRINSGQDNAIMAGLRQADGAYIVIMDDDLQHAPEDIPRLYETCRDGFDICFADFETKKQKLWKNVGSWINGKIAEVSMRKNSDIYLSPFKIIKKEVADAVCTYDGPFPYVDGLIMTVTSNFTQVRIEHHRRFAGQTTYSLRRSITVWGKHITGFSILPLRLASVIGIVTAFLGLCLGLYYVAYYFLYGNVVGWTTLACLLLILGGLILMSLGIIGEYIGRIYLKVNKRPQYVIQSIVRGDGPDHGGPRNGRGAQS